MPEAFSHLLVYLPAYNEFPLDTVRKKDPAEVKEQLDHRKLGQREAVSTYEEYLEKIAKPMLDAFIRSLNPEFVSRAGLTAEEIVRKKQVYLFSRQAYENYIRGFSAEDITRIIEKLPAKSADSVRKKVFGVWRLEGHLTEGGVSAMKIVLGWLGGDKKIVNALRVQDKLIQGEPVLVTSPERTNEFKRKLRTLLTRVLDIIQCAYYDPKVISEQNDRLNRFVNSYLCARLDTRQTAVGLGSGGCAGIVPFTSGGESHLDFVIIPESVIPSDSREVKEIQYKIYSFFLGKERADNIRRTSIEKNYPTPPDPAEYLGNPDPFKQAYFDMNLDIQVSNH